MGQGPKPCAFDQAWLPPLSGLYFWLCVGLVFKFKGWFPVVWDMLARSVAWLVFLIIAFVAASAFIQFLFEEVLSTWFPGVLEYKRYADILTAIGFGYGIVSAFSRSVYWFMRLTYDHPPAAAVRNIIRIVGIGALVAGIAGSMSDPTAGVAIGGFIGMVIGFASQQVLGQALSGLLLLITRPFMIGDKVDAGGEKGMVEDVRILFTVLRREDGNLALIPNNKLIGSKIIKEIEQKEG